MGESTTMSGLYGDQKLVEDAAEFVRNYVTLHFPEGLTPELTLIITEVCLDMFEAGARWADQTANRYDVPQILTASQ